MLGWKPASSERQKKCPAILPTPLMKSHKEPFSPRLSSVSFKLNTTPFGSQLLPISWFLALPLDWGWLDLALGWKVCWGWSTQGFFSKSINLRVHSMVNYPTHDMSLDCIVLFCFAFTKGVTLSSSVAVLTHGGLDLSDLCPSPRKPLDHPFQAKAPPFISTQPISWWAHLFPC